MRTMTKREREVKAIVVADGFLKLLRKDRIDAHQQLSCNSALFQ